jgi:glutamate dehydrogenase
MGKPLAATAKDLPDEHYATFRAALLEHAQEADYNDLSQDALERLTAAMWAFGAARRPGETKLRLRIEEGGKEAGEDAFSVLEIITDDRPFLVSSVLAELGEYEVTVSWLGHPIVAVERDEAGRRVRLVATKHGVRALEGTDPRIVHESMIQIAFTRAIELSDATVIQHKVAKVLSEVGAIVADWQAMQDRLKETVGELYAAASRTTPQTCEEIPETIAFLEWLADNHFIFMGVRDYSRVTTPEGVDLVSVGPSGLGVMRDPEMRVLRRQGQQFSITPALLAFLEEPSPIVVTKANVRSLVQRRVYMDYIGIKRFAADGSVIGERRYVGLFTSAAYNRVPDEIPLLRRKVRLVLERANFPARTHNFNSLQNILETYPRDELFQISLDELYEIATGIMRLHERPRARLFVRFDKFDRFVSALAFVPRERFAPDLREKIGDILRVAFDGRVSAFYPLLSESPLVRIHFIIGRNLGPRPEVDLDELEERVVAAVRFWRDGLVEALSRTHGEGLGRSLLRRFGHAFTAAYREAFTPDEAVPDITTIDSLGANAVGIRAYRQATDAPHELHVKLYQRGELISLSRSLPILEHLGLSVVTEFSYPVTALSKAEKPETVHIHDFLLVHPGQKSIASPAILQLIEAAFPAVWRGDGEDDGFNRLIVEARLSWSEAVILRGLARYLLQTGTSLSQAYMEEALAANPGIARLIVELFCVRFDPDFKGGEAARAAGARAIEADIQKALEGVQVLDQDRILRRFVNLLQAILRTNFYQRGPAGERKEALALKLDSRKIEGLPLPCPMFEIFVYSPRVEGVHLRFGRIARGGIRWSDRREDFRTEVLGLVKAQYVKNAVIVPSGSKGGFVPKRLPLNGSREDIQKEGIACYKLFISSLLDLTDNLPSEQLDASPIPPPRTISIDPPDPYLVVAADKGTASFSDIANAIARDLRFWLGDAFASGGSNGYDHKAMAITAKGAWVAVERHFRELGRDIWTEPFRVIGVGDMSGDVFGNGMLRSRTIRLLAAFDLRDIFLDPNPDPAQSFTERQRLFALPRSSWQDYGPSRISKGGGVFSRTLKSIDLSPEVRSVLGVRAGALSPPDLIRAILKCEADLLWFGGIGTFIKSKAERHADVGDAATDALRVDAEEVRSKVIGEGANLALTQAGRIAFARAGGRINTDAIDNSGGVDCSDHEVNIKILLDMAVAQKALTLEARTALLKEMTHDVAQHVLADNYQQTLALSLAESTTRTDLDAHSRFIRVLEREGRLDRAVERLPSEDQLAELKARRAGLTRPEIAVLLAYSKIRLRDELIASEVPDQPALIADLVAYFPPALEKRFRPQLLAHRLKREIIATRLANELVNLGGLTMVNRMRELTGASGAAVACAYAIAREVFQTHKLRDHINALDNQIAADIQIGLHVRLRTFLRRQVNWFLHRANKGLPDISSEIARYQAPVAELTRAVTRIATGFTEKAFRHDSEKLTGNGVPDQTASAIACLEPLIPACDIVDVAHDLKVPVEVAAAAHGALGEVLGLERLFAGAVHLTSDDHWERLAIRRIVEDLAEEQAKLARAALRSGPAGDASAAVAAWAEAHKSQVARVAGAFEEIESAGSLTAARLALAIGHVRDLAAADAASSDA